MIFSVSIPDLFDPEETLTCGQAFRWKEVLGEDGVPCWEGVAKGHVLRLRKEQKNILFFCSRQDFDDIWRDYFDLEQDYEEKRTFLASLSPVLSNAAEYAPGIRILRQEPWEALCSFIISQNNNIPRIQGIIDRLCRLLGDPIPGSSHYTFPGPEKLAACTVEDLAPLRAGFRAKYLIDAAQKVADKKIDVQKIARSPAEFGRNELQKIMGVGPKVAECALLYGFHKTDCFPMDVWMKRAMEVLLPEMTPADFGENAGLAQQFLFHYSRMHPNLFG